ncbi:hypothetical protein ACFL5O_10560 [Myxococcota bacterium]
MYDSDCGTPRSASAAPVVPEPLRPLVRQLAELDEGDRELVIRAAKLQGLPNEFPALSWESLDEVKGIVAFGGNADEDCKALHDG